MISPVPSTQNLPAPVSIPVTGQFESQLEALYQTRLRSAHPTDFTLAARTSTPAVVYIQAKQLADYNFWSGQTYQNSTGSGVIISDDGFIATNHHVVENATEIKVLLNDKREFNAEIIGTDPATDLALIRISQTGLPYLVYGNSDSLQIGEWVLAVGNPFRLESTVTAGIVSAKGRNINILNNRDFGIESFIQTDAVVNPGNSGGALVNTAGELIGINTAIISYSGQYEGYSFAVPSNLARKVFHDLKEYGVVHRGILGVNIESIDDKLARELGLEKVQGVLISRVFPESAAEDAGLQPGDVIIQVNGTFTSTSPKLQEQLARFRPGDPIRIRYIRDGNEEETTVILKNLLNTTELIATRKDKELRKLGFEVRDLTMEEKRRYAIEGVKVVSINRASVIAETNMAPDYIITRVNGENIKDVDDLINKLNKIKGLVYLEGFYEKIKGDFPYAFNKN
jgi:Do/DeqQ family serine protease